MSVSSVGGNQQLQLPIQTAQTAQRGMTSSEAREVGPDVDGDGDDAGAKVVQAAAAQPAPSVNSSGQQVGTIINVKA
ncbi:TPA: hypothetical protein QDB06_006601 [Burkholderia vietnamiensis]|uniref:hypothetical protein n=1 Tax=Burkholderia vietnamiensis TaxID=60552 RepID=UPI000A4C8833|nr:hypothetical protein [Burkholderia vietnamiensis]HDR9178941.1 hypothetical protein [Burkholderia vietnamiensis]HDR9184877.1 hypothetical protein [Burkholderia vietnamiensis]HDR9185930.1 hypothetical protein [Burkholderia vietnamiensis]